MDSMDAAGAAVARGIAVLDQHGPEGWRSKINLEALDVSDGSWCVLGQVYDDIAANVRAAHREHSGDDCQCVIEGDGFNYGRIHLAQLSGLRRHGNSRAFFDFPNVHGFTDHRVLVEDGSEGIYVSYSDLDDAWKEALTA